MSSIAAELNALATTTVIDFYRRLVRPEAPDAHYLTVSRIATAFWGVFACVVALFATNLGSLIEVVNRFGSFFYGSILGVFMLAMVTRRASGTGAFVGLIGGMVLVASVAFLRPDISFLWHNVIGAVGVVVVGSARESLSRRPGPADSRDARVPRDGAPPRPVIASPSCWRASALGRAGSRAGHAAARSAAPGGPEDHAVERQRFWTGLSVGVGWEKVVTTSGHASNPFPYRFLFRTPRRAGGRSRRCSAGSAATSTRSPSAATAPLGKLTVRPVMVGIRRTWVRDTMSYDSRRVAGPSFNSFKLSPRRRDHCSDWAPAASSSDANVSFAWRLQASTWHDFTDRVAIRGPCRYAWNQAEVTFNVRLLPPSHLAERQLRAVRVRRRLPHLLSSGSRRRRRPVAAPLTTFLLRSRPGDSPSLPADQSRQIAERAPALPSSATTAFNGGRDATGRPAATRWSLLHDSTAAQHPRQPRTEPWRGAGSAALPTATPSSSSTPPSRGAAPIAGTVDSAAARRGRHSTAQRLAARPQSMSFEIPGLDGNLLFEGKFD